VVALRVRGGSEVPLGKIVCLIRNYAKHAREMGQPAPARVTWFLKPASAALPGGGTVRLPRESKNVHHEVELAVVIGTRGRRIPRERALDHVLGYAVCLDMTARDLQDELKKANEPWDLAKGYDTFFPISEVVPAAEFGDPQEKHLVLRRNGQVVQSGHTGDMLAKVADILASVSAVTTLDRGDVIATGTPEGVGPVHAGDHLVAEIEGVVRLEVSVEDEPQ